MKRITIFLAAFAVAGSAVFAQKQTEKTEILVAAAASLKTACEKDLFPLFMKKNPGIFVRGTFDSSGKLQTQIEQGLEADVFLSAATRQMDALVKGGFVKPEAVTPLLRNNLVLICPVKGKTAVRGFKDVGSARTIAIGDPKSVPAGQYAREALTNLGVWDAIPADRLSLGTNVTEVLNWVAQGNAEVGIVYATDAAGNKNVRVIAVLADGVLAEPVVYPAAPLAKSAAPAAAARFAGFLSSKEALAVFKSYGFEPY